MAKKTEAAAKVLPREEWPYEVPGNWVWVTGQTILQPMESTKPTGEMFRYIDIDSIDNKKQVVHSPKNLKTADAPSRASRKLHSGDTIFSLVRPYLRNIAYIDDFLADCIASTGFFVCQPSEYLHSRYLYWLMTSEYVVMGLNEHMKGDNSPSIRKSDIEKYPIPLPPLPEQQRIVSRIESLFGQLDEATELLRSALAKFAARKAALLHRAFTGELTAKWRAEHGVSRDSWEEKRLGELTDIKSSKRIFKDEYVEIGIPFFRSSEIVELNDKGYTLPKYFISEIRYDEISKQVGVPRKGDLLVTSVGTIGKTWLVDDRKFYYKDGNITLLEHRESFSMRYVQHYIGSDEFKSIIFDTVAGTAYNALTIIKFKNIRIPVPTFPEQQEIVRLLDSALAKENAARERIERLLTEIALVKKSLLARAFRGQLGTNDPAEESAAGLWG